MAFTARLRGLDQMKARIAQFQKAFPDRVKAALHMEAQIEMTESKRRCPVDVTPPTPHPGQLRGTGHVETPVREGNKISVAMTYGTDYAVYVHENLEALHPVGEARFLASVLEESQPHIAGRVAARIKASE